MKKKILSSALLCVAAAILLILARNVHGFADAYYTYVYRYIASGFAFVFGLLPFSVSELALYGGILSILIVLILGIGKRVFHKKSKRGGQAVWNGICNIVLIASSLVFLFTINCGVNYHKTGFAAASGFSAPHYTKEQVKSVCTMLTEEINALSPTLKKDKEGGTVYDTNREARAKKAMQELSKTYKSLSGYYPNPKGLMVSAFLSYQDVTGIYSPFTVEANYNADMPDYLKPFTMCHELSHLKGIMREEEANFVAFLACINASDDTVRYSGLMHAYTYCMNELYEYDVEEFKEIRSRICKEADQDIRIKREFWEKYETKVATIATKMNDAYLKANAQTMGTDSYNQVTGLIIEYYQK